MPDKKKQCRIVHNNDAMQDKPYNNCYFILKQQLWYMNAIEGKCLDVIFLQFAFVEKIRNKNNTFKHILLVTP